MVRRAAVLVPILLLVAFSLAAQTDIAFWGAHSNSSTTGDPGGDIRFKEGSGFGLSLSHYWRSHLALELGASELRQSGHVDLAGQELLDVGRLKIRPFTATAQWHLAPGTTFDPFVGIGGAYVFTSRLSSTDLDQSGIGTVDVKNGFAPLANAGANFSIGHNLSLAVDFKYLRFRPDSGPADARVRLNLNPLIAAAGLRWRF